MKVWDISGLDGGPAEPSVAEACGSAKPSGAGVVPGSCGDAYRLSRELFTADLGVPCMDSWFKHVSSTGDCILCSLVCNLPCHGREDAGMQDVPLL